MNDNLLDFIELSDKYNIVKIVATNKLNEKSLGELDMSTNYGTTLVAIKRTGILNITPDPELE